MSISEKVSELEPQGTATEESQNTVFGGRCSLQKDEYAVSWPPERYTIPLLAKRVPELFNTYCNAPVRGAKALDAGCGMQPFRPMIEADGYCYIGFDVIQNRSGTVDVIGGLDGDLPPELGSPGSFQFILCTEVLEHVADWNAAFENLAQCLAPSGRLLITCPHFYPLHEVPYDFWRPTEFAIRYFAESSGLRVIHVEKSGGPLEVLGTLLAETHCYPKTRNLLDRIVAKCGRIVRNAADRLLMSQWVRDRVSLAGPYFLSVYAVLEKPSEIVVSVDQQ
jgi:SAM-dependent methyltransferase